MEAQRLKALRCESEIAIHGHTRRDYRAAEYFLAAEQADAMRQGGRPRPELYSAQGLLRHGAAQGSSFSLRVNYSASSTAGSVRISEPPTPAAASIAGLVKLLKVEITDFDAGVFRDPG